MFDLKKTIILALMVSAIVSVTIAGYMTGKKVGYAEGTYIAQGKEHEIIVKTDSMLRKQTELCHTLMDLVYSKETNSK